MSQNFRCGDQEALIGYLYEESQPDEREAIEAHLTRCDECAEELNALRGTRLQLLSWAPPDARLGFRVVSEPAEARVLRPARWWQQPMPAWAQAAAAIVIFGIGVTLGAVRGSFDRPASPATASAAAGAATVGDLAALERKLRGEMAQIRTPSAARVSVPASAGEAQVLARVRTLIQESEDRQQHELALRSAELVRDFDTQRRVDLSRIERTFGQMEGNTGAEVAQQRQMLNYLMRVSGTPR
jgi:hypothetical protein